MSQKIQIYLCIRHTPSFLMSDFGAKKCVLYTRRYGSSNRPMLHVWPRPCLYKILLTSSVAWHTQNWICSTPSCQTTAITSSVPRNCFVYRCREMPCEVRAGQRHDGILLVSFCSGMFRRLPVEQENCSEADGSPFESNWRIPVKYLFVRKQPLDVEPSCCFALSRMEKQWSGTHIREIYGTVDKFVSVQQSTRGDSPLGSGSTEISQEIEKSVKSSFGTGGWTTGLADNVGVASARTMSTSTLFPQRRGAAVLLWQALGFVCSRLRPRAFVLTKHAVSLIFTDTSDIYRYILATSNPRLPHGGKQSAFRHNKPLDNLQGPPTGTERKSLGIVWSLWSLSSRNQKHSRCTWRTLWHWHPHRLYLKQQYKCTGDNQCFC